MNRIAIDLGFIQIYWYSITMLLGVILGGIITFLELKRLKMNTEYFFNMIFYVIIFGFIGARIYYVIFNLDYYTQDLTSIFKVWEGGLAIHGGLIAGVLFIIFYTKKHKINTLRILDFMVVGLIIGQAIGRWGNFFNSEAHGPVTTLETLQNLFIPEFIIDGMNIGGNYYHPTFLYESLWCIIGFIMLIIIRRFKYLKIGQLTSVYLVWYGIGRFIIEGMRTDSLMFGTLKIAQLVSILMIIFGIISFIKLKKGPKFQNLYNGDDYNE